MKTFEVKAAAGGYPVVVGQGALNELGLRMRALGFTGKVALVTDQTVAQKWLAPVLGTLHSAGLQPVILQFPAGEQHKTLATVEPLYGELIRAGLGRRDPLVALGGGVVGDLAGFLAATYYRGMPLVQVPTTLLAQVDASIGGKVAVDHPLGKNLVGAFHAPRLVVSDLQTLGTLTDRERWNGLAEVVKAALIADLGLLEELEQTLESLGDGSCDPARAEAILGRAIQIKVDVVSQDEKESGVRMLLNFGHTLGHAVETATGHGPLTHGECVVIGMRAAIGVSQKLGRLAAEPARRALNILARFPRPPGPITRPSVEAVRAAFGRDKKQVAGQVRFIILEELGRAEIVPSLPPEILEEGIALALAEL